MPAFIHISSALVVMATTPASHPGFLFPIGNFRLSFKMPMILENPLNIQPCLMTNVYHDIYKCVSDFQFCQTSVRIFFDFQSFWMMGLQWSLTVSCRLACCRVCHRFYFCTCCWGGCGGTCWMLEVWGGYCWWRGGTSAVQLDFSGVAMFYSWGVLMFLVAGWELLLTLLHWSLHEDRLMGWFRQLGAAENI